MSRIGRKPILIPARAEVMGADGEIVIKGPKGELKLKWPDNLELKKEDGRIIVVPQKGALSNLHGLHRALLENAVIGVSGGWTKELELVGVGYRARTDGTELVLTVGYSHPVVIKAGKGISFTVAENNKITVAGVDKYLVGEIAAKIRNVRPPEPYKGKGIRYKGEIIRRKAGKAAKTSAGAGSAGGKAAPK